MKSPVLRRRKPNAERPYVIRAGGASKYQKGSPRTSRNLEFFEGRLAGGCEVCGTHEMVEFHHTGGNKYIGKSMRGRAATMGEAAFAAELATCKVLCKTHHRAAHKALKSSTKADGSSVGKKE